MTLLCSQSGCWRTTTTWWRTCSCGRARATTNSSSWRGPAKTTSSNIQRWGTSLASPADNQLSSPSKTTRRCGFVCPVTQTWPRLLCLEESRSPSVKEDIGREEHSGLSLKFLNHFHVCFPRNTCCIQGQNRRRSTERTRDRRSFRCGVRCAAS